MEWFYILRGINDEDLKVICGTDGALYIIFVRYAAVLFFVMSIFNLLLFVPIYASGTPLTPKEIQDSQGRLSIVSLVTIMNITGKSGKVLTVYILMMIFYTFMAFVFMFFYWNKSV